MATMTPKIIHESNLIEGFDDPKVDKASMEAWLWLKNRLRRNKQFFNHEVIQELNRRLTTHQPELSKMWLGAYRSRSKTRVFIGMREGMSPDKIDKAMDEWIEMWLTSTDVKATHIAFEKIHPFIDGNGRTGRMLMWLQQKYLGEPFTLIEKKNVQEYYNWFKED